MDPPTTSNPPSKLRKSILKSSPVTASKPHLHATFDELNVLETLHPKNKDYGLMKIDEPKTPFHTSEHPNQELNIDLLTEQLNMTALKQKRMNSGEYTGAETDDERRRRLSFERRRKEHYNEFKVMKLASQKIADNSADHSMSSIDVEITGDYYPEKKQVRFNLEGSELKKGQQKKEKTPSKYDFLDDPKTKELHIDAFKEKLRGAVYTEGPAFGDNNDNSSEDDCENEEDLVRRLAFVAKRKVHYTEFHTRNEARKLIQEEMDGDASDTEVGGLTDDTGCGVDKCSVKKDCCR